MLLFSFDLKGIMNYKLISSKRKINQAFLLSGFGTFMIEHLAEWTGACRQT
jgi:hypothetical protein